MQLNFLHGRIGKCSSKVHMACCCRYESAKKRGDYDEESLKREHARVSLQRYMHYYQRWAENDKARALALQHKRTANDEVLESLSELVATPTSQLKFILDAWSQVRPPCHFSCEPVTLSICT